RSARSSRGSAGGGSVYAISSSAGGNFCAPKRVLANKMILLNTPFRIPGRHVTDQLNAYLDYELPEADRDLVRDHLRRCPERENEWAPLRAPKQRRGDVPVARAPRSFALSVEQADALKARPVSRIALATPQNRLSGLAVGLRLAASAAFV